MATGGNTGLSDSLIEKLSEAVDVTEMETIAISYLKVQSQMVTNLRVAYQRNPIAFKSRSVNHMEMYESENRSSPGQSSIYCTTSFLGGF